MSKNYDNWERLVVAVVRREFDRQLAYTRSYCDSSSINSVSSLDLSFDSTARFDEDDVGIGMSNNYHDILEKLSRVVLQREGEMLTAQTSSLLERIEYSDLQTLHHNDWKTMLLPHQRQLVWRSASLIFFPDTSMEWRKKLFLGRIEKAYLLVAFTGNYAGVPFAAFSNLKIFPNESGYQCRRVRFDPGNGRSDGWMEVELGDFYVYPGEDREVQVQLMFKMHMGVEDVVIEGIEFRPSKANRFFSKIIQFDDDDDDNDDLGDLKRTGKNSLMLGARALLISWEDNPSCWKWTTHHHSRFAEVVELKYVWWLKIRGKINTRMLFPKNDYGCRGLEQAKGMVRFVDKSSENDAEKEARVLNLLEAVSRADGWMEIEIGSFYVDQGNEREVEAQLFEIRCNLKSGLIVEGIEFRPV